MVVFLMDPNGTLSNYHGLLVMRGKNDHNVVDDITLIRTYDEIITQLSVRNARSERDDVSLEGEEDRHVYMVAS